MIKYYKSIDSLRWLSIIFVILFHYFPNVFKGGFVGVDIFFVISGYLIGLILISNNEKLSHFYIRRIKRLFPSLIFTILLILLLGYFVLFPQEYKNLGLHALAGLFFISNFLLFTENDYFNKASELKLLLNLWSLSVEVQLYIIISILFILINFFKLSIKYIIILILSSFFISISNINKDLIFYLPLTRFFEFGLG